MNGCYIGERVRCHRTDRNIIHENIRNMVAGIRCDRKYLSRSVIYRHLTRGANAPIGARCCRDGIRIDRETCADRMGIGHPGESVGCYGPD